MSEQEKSGLTPIWNKRRKVNHKYIISLFEDDEFAEHVIADNDEDLRNKRPGEDPGIGVEREQRDEEPHDKHVE